MLNLANNPGAAPVDMRANICGKGSQDYAKAQEAAFPMGLKGQPSYLTDTVVPNTYVATDLGRMAVGVVLPRPRPAHLPIFTVPTTTEAALDGGLRPGVPVAAGGNIPVQRTRPVF
ncbi:hypothetical protein N8D56_11225 [Devosia sp. A8/3-2]|nr:hypothetical protein N8D56_11225 [Devosia sp. A8/3-2]